jgi:hypothetical protein
MPSTQVIEIDQEKGASFFSESPRTHFASRASLRNVPQKRMHVHHSLSLRGGCGEFGLVS